MKLGAAKTMDGRWLAVAIVATLTWCACAIHATFLDGERTAQIQWEPGEPMPSVDETPPLWFAIPAFILLALLSAGFLAAPLILLKDAYRHSRLEKQEW